MKVEAWYKKLNDKVIRLGDNSDFIELLEYLKESYTRYVFDSDPYRMAYNVGQKELIEHILQLTKPLEENNNGRFTDTRSNSRDYNELD